MIDAVIWDAGGTLFDTYPAVVSSAEHVLGSYGVAADPGPLRALFRRGTQLAVDALAQRTGTSAFELGARFEAAYSAVSVERQPPFPHVEACLRHVRARGGRNFIVTHRDAASLARLLDGHAMRRYFTDWVTKDDPYPRKPEPASLLALAERYDLTPRRCLVVGDRGLDAEAAARAGMLSCHYGVRQIDCPVDMVVTGYDELLVWLRRNLDG